MKFLKQPQIPQSNFFLLEFLPSWVVVTAELGFLKPGAPYFWGLWVAVRTPFPEATLICRVSRDRATSPSVSVDTD